MTLQDILKRKNFEATAVNQYGEGVYLGTPTTVKHLKYEYSFTWNPPIMYSSPKSPLDTLLLHDGNKILRVIPVSVFRLDNNVRSLTVKMI